MIVRFMICYGAPTALGPCPKDAPRCEGLDSPLDFALCALSGEPRPIYFFNRVSVPMSYFVLVNNSRKTIEKGSQVFFCYGQRSNRQLMKNYGFCFANNKYNSYEFGLRFDWDTSGKTELKMQDIIEFNYKKIPDL